MSRSATLDRSHCLQYVDPYGDATFNQLQLPQLLREMEHAIDQLQPSAAAQRIRRREPCFCPSFTRSARVYSRRSRDAKAICAVC